MFCSSGWVKSDINNNNLSSLTIVSWFLGSNSIAIGQFAGQTGQPKNTIVLNANGTAINGNGATITITNGSTGAFYVAPIRNTDPTGINGTFKSLYYNTLNKEITSASIPLTENFFVGG